MEHGKSSKFDSNITENANPSPNNAENTSEERQVRQLGAQDPYMPTANVVRIMRQILPAHAKISDDAKEIIQVCISEYISFITSEANHLCQSEKRKTITAEDVLWAMEKLGFDDYIHPLTVFLHRYRNQNNPSSLRGETSSVKRTAADCGPPIGLPPTPAAANYGPSFPMGPNLSTGFSDLMGMGGSSSEGAGVSSSQNDSAQFDFLTYLQSLRKQ